MNPATRRILILILGACVFNAVDAPVRAGPTDDEFFEKEVRPVGATHRVLIKARRARGALDFDAPEAGFDIDAVSARTSAWRILSSRRRNPPTTPPIAAPAAAPLPASPVIAPPTAPSAAPRAAPCRTGGGDDDGRWLADWEFALCGLLGSNPVCCTAQEWHSYRSLSCCAWFCPFAG